MSCIIVAELLVIGFFNLWPANQSTGGESKEPIYHEDAVLLEDAVITRQQSSPPPPPRPRSPIPEPTDEIIEEQIVELNNVEFSEYSDSLSVSRMKGAGNNEGIANAPSRPPRVLRIVEATTSDQAKKAGIRAEITVSFLVDKQGNVEEANISKIKLYEGESGDYKIVDTIDYGLTEATLSAALQWKFRPAQKNGEPVKAYSRQIFTFGF